jgi:hypothetical protein
MLHAFAAVFPQVTARVVDAASSVAKLLAVFNIISAHLVDASACVRCLSGDCACG